MNRKPPDAVIKQLRTEVGFGCPVPECGNPYLEWHHFDPPWRVEQHHNPEGMIALCAEHHKKADYGAYTNEQLTSFKKNKVNSALVRGKFDWRRNKLLAVVGGSFYFETNRILVIDGHDVISFTRDEEGYLLLNIKMISLSDDVRAEIKENIWENIGHPVDLISPPSGKKLCIRYSDGDYLEVEFYVIENSEKFSKKFNCEAHQNLDFPITAVEINCEIGDTEIKLTPKQSTLLNQIQLKGCFISSCGVGVMLETKLRWRQNNSLIPSPKSRLSPCPCESGKRYKHCHGVLR